MAQPVKLSDINGKAFQNAGVRQQLSEALGESAVKPRNRKKRGKRQGDQTVRNTQNQVEGAWFQDQLDAYHKWAESEGLLIGYRTMPETVQTGAFTARIIGKGPVDYISYLPDGQCVHFDAKSRQGDAFTATTRHQRDWLGTMHGWGFIAGWLVYWKDHNECRWHPYKTEKRIRRAEGIPVAQETKLYKGKPYVFFYYQDAL